MHPHFADWHRGVEIEPRAEDLDSRWSVIEDVVASMSADDAVSMVAVAHGSAPFSPEWPRSFAQAFKDVDATFPMLDNATLLSVLAAAAAVHALVKADQNSDLVAYAVRTSSAVGRSAAVADLSFEANSYLANEGVQQRELQDSPAPLKPTNTMPKALEEAVAAATSPSYPGAVSHERFVAVIDQVVATINKSSNAAGAHSAKVATWAQRALSQLREELDMLWWLVSGHSSSAGRPWRELDPAAAAVAVGWELAGLVTILPGPPVATELLRQLLEITFDDAPTVSVSHALESLPEGLPRPRSIDAIIDLMPIVAVCAGRVAAADLAAPQPLLDIADRAYNEALLVRAYEAAS